MCLSSVERSFSGRMRAAVRLGILKASDESMDREHIKSRISTWLSIGTNIKRLRYEIEEDEAHEIVELLTKLTEDEGNPSPFVTQCDSLRRKLLRTFGINVLPSSIYISNVHLYDDSPRAGGGYSNIYVGKWSGTSYSDKQNGQDTKVAIKRLIIPKSPQMVQTSLDFGQEVLTWKRFRHPHVLALLGITRDVFRSDFLPSIVTPWKKHSNILEYLKKTPAANRLQLMRQVAAGLQYIHSWNTIHGDIKPLNIIINDDETASLCDFGLMRIAHTSAFETTMEVSEAGTVQYMAPELFRAGQDSTRKTDIYAMAMTMFHVLTGHLPFPKYHDGQVLVAVANGQRPDLSEEQALTPPIRNLIRGCWMEISNCRPTADDLYRCISNVHYNSE